MENIDHEIINKKADIFKILSNNVRLCILTNLYINGEKKVNEITKCANSSQSFVSQQLIKLKNMGVISDRKEGVEVYYKIINEDIKRIIELFVI